MDEPYSALLSARARDRDVRPSVPFVVASALLLAACGSTSGPQSTGNVFIIHISSFQYIPQNLTVPPGATIVVQNEDLAPHSVTSEASAGSFIPGAVAGVSFDTGEFSNAQTIIQIPSTAPDGTVVPFYCTVHKAAMNTPGGSITIRAFP